MRWGLAITMCAVWGCGDGGEQLRAEPRNERGVRRATAAPVTVEAAPVARDEGPKDAPPKPLPVLGDPLGLLSKPTPAPEKARHGDPLSALDPGALMNDTRVDEAPLKLERDPRAIQRSHEQAKPRASASGGSVRSKELSARAAIGRARSSGRPHVLYLYAAYCKACRKTTPELVELARSYQKRGVTFTAASVDRQQQDFDAYAGVLGGVLEALWITPEGKTRDELVRAGITLEGEGYAIPFFAVFKSGSVAAQGNSRELRKLPKLLDGLL